MKFHKIIICLFCVAIAACSHGQKQEITAADFSKKLKKGEPVEIANKIILGDVDFTSMQKLQMLSASQIQNVVESNIFFVNCVFMGNVTASGTYKDVPVQTRFNNNVVFRNCDFRGEVNFDNATVFGKVDFEKAKFRAKASFNNLSVWSGNTTFAEIETENAMTMFYAAFHGDVSFMDANFQEAVSLQGAKVAGSFVANGIRCAKSAEFDMMNIGGRAIFNYASFAVPPTYINVRFHDDAEFTGVPLENLPETFEKTYFYGKLHVGDTVYPSRKEYPNLLKQE